MKTAKRIEQMEPGVLFGYPQLGIEKAEYSAAAKAVGRLIEAGVVKRIKAGVFYKPRKTVFGELKPSDEQMLMPYLFDNGKRVAYVTGPSLYNKMGLTTQVPNTIKVAGNDTRVNTQIGALRIQSAKAYVKVTNTNFRMLEMLDAIKDFKRISDLDKKSAIRLIGSKIAELSDKELGILVKCALKYPPRTIALLGALLEDRSVEVDLQQLRDALNPFTAYNLSISSDLLATAPSWHIQ